MLNIREKVIDVRVKYEEDVMNKMVAKNQVSPRTYNSKKEELEKWYVNEK